MMTAISNPLAWRRHGYALSYRAGEQNHCPGCGRQHWIVGRLMAECAFCGTALPMMHIHGYGATQSFVLRGRPGDELPDGMQAVA
jgi:hypothetical protein